MPKLLTCTTCGAPFKRERYKQAKCPLHEGRGREHRSPTTRAQDTEYAKERARILAPDPLTGMPPVCALRIRCDGAPATTADHVIPVAKGGVHRGNLQPACASCNASKQASSSRATVSRGGAPIRHAALTYTVTDEHRVGPPGGPFRLV